MTTATHRLCPACGTDNKSTARLPYSQDSWDLKQCRQCQFVYLENAPAYVALEEEIAWEKTKPEEKARRRKEEPIAHLLNAPLKRFRKHVLKRQKLVDLVNRYAVPGRILDVGCGPGRKLEPLPHHFIPHGIEISKGLAAVAHAAFEPRGGRVVNSDAVSGLVQFPADYFSGIIMCAFLEHETQPGPALAGAFRVLKPGGHLILKVPNYGSWNRRIRQQRWCGFRFPDHVNYFTPKTLRHLLADKGFTLKQFNLFDRLPTSDNMWIVAEKQC